MKHFYLLKRFSFLFAALFIYQTSFSQGVTTASINGIVRDESGSGLPGATVLAVHKPSGTQYGVSTREDGRYTFPSVRTGGPYTITVTFIGYEGQIVEGITLGLGQNFTQNFNISESSLELQGVEVTATQDDILNSDRTGASTNIKNEQLAALPTLNRGIQDFTRLTPQASGSNSFGGRDGRYNNLTIDGSIFNNSFGLADVPAGQTGAQPISLDAIEEIQVNLAPYDVRQGGFTGAGINAITRSGTNDFKGSVYYFTRSQNLIGSKALDSEVKTDDFSVNQYGFRLGGPILKNKLFFFVNAELERQSRPSTPYVAARPGIDPSDPNATRVQASDLDELSTFLNDRYGYNTGEYEGYNFEPFSDKVLARLDWNINQNNKFSLRYNYLRSFTEVLASNSTSSGGRRSNQFALNFRNSNYEINNDISSIIAEYNSTIGNRFSNNLIFGYTSNRDYRSSGGGIFPLVDILEEGRTYTTFGYEPFTANNRLNTDTWQLSNNFTYYAGKHTLTAGFNVEYFKFENTFTPFYYGYYRFGSLQDFYDSANGVVDPETNQVVQPVYFRQTYSALPGRALPTATTEFVQTGFYLQDAFEALSNLKVTAGLRVDIPSFPFEALRNPEVETLTFQDVDGSPERYSTSTLPKTSLLWSPRVGFNWDVNSNRSTQVRGGTGVFSGRIPFVYISNQVGNNGVLTGLTFEQDDDFLEVDRRFTDDVTAYLPENPSLPPTYNIAVTVEDFKFPQVWRSNIALDQQLPLGFIGTLEAIYTKDLNNIYYRNANLAPSEGTFQGADNRPRYASNTSERRINSNITDAIVLDNTSEGYSYSLTAQLSKQFTSGLYVMAAYNFGKSKLLSSGGSQAFSSWAGNPNILGPNNPAFGYSNDDQRHRIITSVSYRKEYAGFMGTQISLFYNARNQGRYSYTYNGDMNFDGLQGNDLIYIPADQSEINLVDITNANGDILYTTEEQYAALEAYIAQDDYLAENRGNYAERNGGVAPWVSQLDISLMQDFYITVGEKRNTLQLRADIFNFGNMLNSNWGVGYSQNNSQFLSFKGVDAGGESTFSLAPVQGALPTSTFRRTANISDIWQMQLGVRYIFN